MNSIFIVIVPKVGEAIDIKDFRPISLVGCVYKLIAKVLTRRMAKALHMVIGERQHSFVGGKHILDAILIANEVVDDLLNKKREGILCKLDMEKTYDHMNWGHVDYMLIRLGFGENGEDELSHVMVNGGGSSSFFWTSRGFRQGDPLFQLLFLVAIEGLNKMSHLFSYRRTE